MRFPTLPFALLLGSALLLGGCSTSRPLPKFEKPLARTPVQTVRTTAYTHTESDHRKYARQTALGTTLQSGEVKSAATDWSRWPAGTIFRLRETGELYKVDDYGWALAGTNTIDLYKPSRSAMNSWGARRVTIDVLHWGDPWKSYSVLKPTREAPPRGADDQADSAALLPRIPKQRAASRACHLRGTREHSVRFQPVASRLCCASELSASVPWGACTFNPEALPRRADRGISARDPRSGPVIWGGEGIQSG